MPYKTEMSFKMANFKTNLKRRNIIGKHPFEKKTKQKTSLILYLGQKWAPIEINGENCNLEHSKISQNKTPGDGKVTSSLGFSSKNLLE